MAASILKGTAYLTGAASGIGKGAAFALARNGITRLALTDISQKSLDATKKELKEKFPKLEIECMQLDVCDGKAIEQSIAETVKRFGRIDVGINVAGIGGSGKTTAELEESGWMSVIDVNLNGVWRSQKEQIKAMLKQENLGPRLGRGNIINIASMYGLVGTPQSIPASAYTASKHGVIGLTKADANTFASEGIRINAICPGYVRTPLLQESTEAGLMDTEIAKTPMGRMAEVGEIGDCIVFLASPMASFMVGSSLLADGGYTGN
ncbi:3-oxoacyl-reductase [Halenospora varia]|nr:3-oxoacyl-reductase [Halenospora varia]